MMRRNGIWKWHVFAWCLIIAMQLLSEFGLGNPDFRNYNLALIGLFAFVRVSVFYAFYAFIAAFLTRKKIGLYTSLGLIAAYVIPNMYSFIYLKWIGALVNPQHTNDWMLSKSFYFMSEGLVVGIIGTIAYWAREGLIRQNLDAQMKQEKTNLELQALRNKLNPHFLFNTLNNIYYLVRQHREEAPEAVLQLSDTMRYILTASSKQTVSVIQELEAVRNMLNLIQYRVGADFQIKIMENIEVDHQVLPTLMLNLIENAMKHGDLSDGGFLHTEVNSAVNSVFIRVENTILKKPDKELDSTSQYGISSLVRLLELTYPETHEIIVNTRGNRFQTTIEIQLA